MDTAWPIMHAGGVPPSVFLHARLASPLADLGGVLPVVLGPDTVEELPGKAQRANRISRGVAAVVRGRGARLEGGDGVEDARQAAPRGVVEHRNALTLESDKTFVTGWG